MMVLKRCLGAEQDIPLETFDVDLQEIRVEVEFCADAIESPHEDGGYRLWRSGRVFRAGGFGGYGLKVMPRVAHSELAILGAACNLERPHVLGVIQVKVL